jgi:NhaP-type Na+/H+ or K+/H+ antiporter
MGDVRVKAERLEQRVRGWKIAGGLLFGVVIGAEAWQVWRPNPLLERTGDLLTIAAFVYTAYWFRRYAPVGAVPGALGRTASVDFYRMRLERQRELASHPWRYLAVFIPGVALSLFGHASERPIEQNAAIAVVGVLLFVIVAWVIRRTGRQLQHELDDLG